jgi:DNA-binding SARP family transcriptional activator
MEQIRGRKLLHARVGMRPIAGLTRGHASKAVVSTNYLTGVLRAWKAKPATPFLRPESVQRPIRIRALGGFSVEKDELSLESLRKSPEKPLAILKMVIALGDRAVQESSITDLLWPESEGDLAHRSFQVTLHRLRGLLGHPEALVLHQGRLSLNPRSCWVDVWEFEAFLEQSAARLQENNLGRASEMMENAIVLYRGPFLGGEAEEPWAISRSERLRSKLLRNLQSIAESWAQAGRWPTAKDCYWKGLEVDDLEEECCRGLMTCYWKMDQRSEALLLYRRFEKRLAAVLGIEPSAKTRALRDALIRGRSS